MPDNGTAATAIHNDDGKWVSNGAYRSHAEKLIAAHNDDCDAYEARIAELEAERDELQRRRGAVVLAIRDNAESACYCEYNSREDRILHCEYCEFMERAVAIAEGRDNGA